MKKKALAIISFGTTYPIAREAIGQLEKTLSQHFEGYDLYRAFTSKMVINKIWKEEKIKIDTPEELMNKLSSEGYEEIVCQSLHIINGIEFDKMKASLIANKDRFKYVKLGQPLLNQEYDYEFCAQAMMKNLPPLQADEALVFMGHGTEHFANAAYCQLENTFRFLGHENVYVGTVEGFPDLDYIMGRLSKKQIKKVYLTPFMIVAGDHAQVDLGGDDEESWKSILKAKGYEIDVIMKGLGEYSEIGELFLKHAEEADNL